MAHPHAAHRQHHVEKRRVHHLTKGYAHGGAVHSDAAADAAMIKRMVKRKALKMHGGKVHHRADKRARGGRTKHKAGKTVVNVISGHQPSPMIAPNMPPPAAAAPMPVPVRPPVPVGAAPLPGGPPLGPRASGGRAYKRGGAVKSGPAWTESMDNRKSFVNSASRGYNKDDQGDVGRGRQITYARGGKVHSDEAADKKLFNKMMAAHERKEMKVEGKVHHRARGGRTEAAPRRSPERNEAPKRTYPHRDEAPKAAAPLTPHLPGGSGGGLARLKKQHSSAFHG